MGHDAINQWIVGGAECKRLGINPECQHCKGEGTIWDSPEDEQAAEDWKRSEPPGGDGYQIWETVSEGSPISPVFATPEELARHMESYKLGDKLETAHKYIIFDAYCPGSYGMIDVSQKPPKPPAKAICDKGHFFCRVDLDEEGAIVKETVTMLDGKTDKETIIYEKEIE